VERGSEDVRGYASLQVPDGGAYQERGGETQTAGYGEQSGDAIGMDLASILAAVKSIIVEGIGLSSLVLAGVALLLIEFWGIKKIWRLMNKPDD
jgi:hypothetical protein